MNEMCPSCHEVKEMQSSDSSRLVTQADGKVSKIITTSFSCAECGQFVRSEDFEHVEDKS